jgi:CRISPR system Cascade subunit CasC
MKKELATVDLKTLAPPIKNKDKTDGEDKDENNLDNAEEETNKKDSKKIKISYSKDLKNIIRAYKNTFLSPDIALFGRMIAEANYLDVDASCQMAHVISTNKIEQESDYFTASDDLKPDDVSGSNMMEDIGYNSSCFYRYSNINIDKLMENLNNDVDLVKNTIISFVKGNIYAIPSAKQNSMAAQNLPSFVFIVIRDSGAPMSLANAFATPIKPEYNGNLIELSVKSLCEYWNSMKNMYGEDGVSFTGVSYNCDSKYVVDFSDNIPINNLIEEIKNNL